ncbi:pyridoxal-phosphate-dependent aminotransferase family protein [candidate division KSB1 bacterium]
MKEFANLNPSERILMGPGPSNIHRRVYEAMAKPTLGHLDPEFLAIMEEVQELLRWAFKTKNRMTLPVSATGSAGMETCFANLFERGEKVVIGVNGVFGMRMEQVAKKFGLQPVSLTKDWGKVFEPDVFEEVLKSESDVKGVAVVHAETSTGARQPLEEIGQLCRKHDVLFLVDAVTSLGGIELEVDGWNIDACYSGTQKCLSCPPGLSPVTFSDRALDTMANRKTDVESWYFDLNMLRNYWTTGKRAYHHTAPVNMNYALREALLVLHEEGFKRIYARHVLNSSALLAGLAELGIEPLVEEEYRLPELNAVTIPEGIDDAAVRGSLLNDYNIEIGAGLGPFAGKIWRIGLMGQSSNQSNVICFLYALEQILNKLGSLSETGRAVPAAQAVYAG